MSQRKILFHIKFNMFLYSVNVLSFVMLWNVTISCKTIFVSKYFKIRFITLYYLKFFFFTNLYVREVIFILCSIIAILMFHLTPARIWLILWIFLTWKMSSHFKHRMHWHIHIHSKFRSCSAKRFSLTNML